MTYPFFRAASGMRHAFLVAALAFALIGCPVRRDVTVVQDVTVSFDAPTDRSPLAGPSARLAAAATEVRQLLGHPLAIVIDKSLAPEFRDSLDAWLTEGFERFATMLEECKQKDPPTLLLAQKRLARIFIRYAPEGHGQDRAPRFEGDDAVAVTVTARDSDTLPAGDIMWLLRRTAAGATSTAFAGRDPATIAPAEQATYLRWLDGSLDYDQRHGATRETDDLARIQLALRFTRTVAPEHREALLRLLIDSALSDLAYDRYAGAGATSEQASTAMAAWLERDFDKLPAAWRARVHEILLGRGAKNARLLAAAWPLAVRTVDAWRAAGHPLPGGRSPIPHELEVVVCPRPKDASDHRSLAPNCEGGIVRLAFRSDAGRARLADLLASRRDPMLVEQVMVSAGSSTYGGGQSALFALVRAVENDAPSLRAALRVLAEDHVYDASPDVWVAELRRLWLARPGARGTILYVLVHLDQYRDTAVDFSDFAGDFGAPIAAEEARAFFGEGYQAISLAPVMWPGLGRGFSRASLLRPHLDAYLDDPRVHSFNMLDPYEALVHIRHRLCDEAAYADLRDLSAYFAARVQERPGKGLGDMSKTYDPRTCDAPCLKMQGDTCVRRGPKR